MGAAESTPVRKICITRSHPSETYDSFPYYTDDIARDTLDNTAYRRVVWTSPTLMQMVFMSIPPGGRIPTETHPATDQFIRVESGTGTATLDGQAYELKDDASLIIPAGSRHLVVNTSDSEPLKMYMIYSPPEHAPSALEFSASDAA